MSVFKNSVIVPVCLLFNIWQIQAQTNEERRERADKLFEKEQYVEATKDYLHLLSLEPRSADFNFRYGACLLFNSNKKNESIRYLAYAITEPSIDPRAFYFHGLALHLNYQFSEAQRSYGTYVNLTIGKSDKRYPADRQIEMCNNGKRLLTTFTDIIVAEKQEIDNSKFFRIYTDANTIGGDILVTAKFQSKMDVKMGHVPIVHFPPNASAIYYSSYGESLANGKDIYVRRRLPNGEWGDPQMLPGMVNTPFDEDFPYMHPSRNYLYFSSTGHNSMGGYDVYMSRFDPNTNTFREPENVDFAISSPDDDFFYVVDSLFQNAYFASARQSQDGMLHVYKVKVARVPLKEVIIMGEFISEVDPEMKSLEINLTYHSNGKDVGLVKSNKVGKYSYVFPQGGKYNYQISVAGLNEEYRFVVDLPFLDELRPLKQKIIHTKEDGKDVLKILNLFDEDVEGAEAIIAEVIRKKAELDVNIDEYNLEEIENESRTKEILAELGFTNMNPEEVIQQLEELASINSDKAKVIDQIDNNLSAEIIAKSERIKTLNKVQAELTEQVMKTSDPIAKHNLLSEAQRKESEKLNLINSVNGLVVLKDEAIAILRTSDNKNSVQHLLALKTDYEKMIRADDQRGASELLLQNKDLILNSSKGTPDDLLAIYVDKSTSLRNDLKNIGKKEQEINRTIETANQEINRLQGLIEVSKKKDIPLIEKQIADKKEEIEMAQADLSRQSDKKRETAKELAIVEEQIPSLQSAMNADEIIAVKNDDVERSVKNVAAIEDKPRAIDYEAELARIEEESPALFKGEEGLTLHDQVRTDLNKQRSQIAKDPNLSNTERVAKELELVEDSKEALETRLTEIKNEMASGGSEELSTEERKTSTYLQQLNADSERLKEELNELRQENPDLAYSKDDLLREIDPKFESDIKTIRTSDQDELLMVTEELQRTNEFIRSVDQERSVAKEQFDSDPENAEAEAKLELLNELLTQFEARSKELANQKDKLEEERAVKPMDPEQIYPGFNEQIAALQVLEDKTKQIEEEKILQNELLTRIAAESKRVEKELRKTPENIELQRKMEAMDLLKARVDDRLMALDEESRQTDVSSVNLFKEENYIADYTSRLNEIESNVDDGQTKLENRIELNSELIDKLRSAVEDRQKSLERNPDDPKIESEIEQIVTLQKRIENEIERDRKELDDLLQPSVLVFKSREDVRKSVLPEYSDRRTEIQNDEVMNEKYRREAIVELNKSSINELNEVLLAIATGLDKEPTNADLINSKQLVEQVIVELKTENKQLDPVWETRDLNAATALVSEFDRKRTEIKENGKLSDEEKIIGLVRLEKELQSSAERELESVKQKLNEAPDGQQLKTAQSDLIKILDDSKEAQRELNSELPLALREFGTTSELLSAIGGDQALRVSDEAISSAGTEEKEKLVQMINELSEQLKLILDELESTDLLTKEEKAFRRIITEQLINELAVKAEQLQKVSDNAVNVIDPKEILPVYSKEMEKINTDPSISRVEQLEKLTDLEKQLVNAASKKLVRIDKKLEKSPEDTDLKDRKEALNSVINAAEDRIAEQEQMLAAERSGSDRTLPDDDYLATIFPSIQELIDQRNSTTDPERLVELEYELLQVLNAKKKYEEKKGSDSKKLAQIEALIEAQNKSYNAALTMNFDQKSEAEKLKMLENIVPNIADRRSVADNSTKEAIQLESDIQDAISERILELQKEQAKKPSVRIDMELYDLGRMRDESEDRAKALNSASDRDIARVDFIQENRNANGIDFELDEDLANASLQEIKSRDDQLAEYEGQLKQELIVVKEVLEQEDDPELREKKEWLEAELVQVESARRKYSVRIGELETTVERKTESAEIVKIDQRISELDQKLTSESLSQQERREITRELRDLEKDKALLTNDAVALSITNEDEETEQVLNSAIESDPNNETLTQLKELVGEVEQQRSAELDRISELKDPLERSFELEKEVQVQERMSQFVEEVLIDEQKLKIQEESGVELFERSELEDKKRRFIVRLGELTTEIERKKKENESAKGTDNVRINNEIAALESEKTLVQQQIVNLEEQLSKLGAEVSDEMEAAMDISVDFKEERELAGTEAYRNYEPAGAKAYQKAEQIRNLEVELGELKEELNDELASEVKMGRRGSASVGELVQQIKERTEELDKLKVEYIQEQYAAERLLPANEDEAMKFRNLVGRGIKPIETAVLAMAIMQMPSDGFAIGERLDAGESRKIPIAVGVEQPSGLVYRVQVGAFARPIQDSLFSEFTPVSGEKIEGTNITRYMAGYFNSSTNVLDARDQIRQLGYSDAFIVAYCNGKRIQFGEARRLEAEGICVPKGSNEIMIEVAENTAENLGIPLASQLTEVKEHDYNKAPGAAKADAIEDKQGLFVTVQIGVFNRPVSESVLYGMKEILTFRLPNGQIRYSSGMFDSFEAAVPRRTEALDNGVIGAFITAYYKGERITIQEARKLLEENGESILESRQQIKKVVPEVVQPEVKVEPKPIEDIKPVEEIKMRVQIVTKKKFDSFPRDILNRYNTEGSFFFDETDGRVKSAIYEDEDHLPRLYNFRKDIDTVYIPFGLLADEQTEIMEISIASDVIPGDLMDWMLRYNKRRVIFRDGDALQIRFMGIRNEEKEPLSQLMNQMGYLPEFVKENELELELKND